MTNKQCIMDSLTDAKDHAVEAATQATNAGVQKTRKIVHDVDHSVHTYPWSIIAGSVVAGIILGYMLPHWCHPKNQ